MKIMESFSLAIRNIRSSKVRTFLTMLGIIIGVGAVIIIAGLGTGLKGYMMDSFSSMGSNVLTVSIIGRGGSTRSITVDQMYKLVADNPEYFNQISPTVRLEGKVKIGNETADSTTATGVSEDYLSMNNFTLLTGRGINYNDIANRNKICVVGSYVADIRYDGNAIGQTIKLGGSTYNIVGVLEPESEVPEEGGTDDAVYVPYSTAARLTGTGNISSYSITIADETQAAASKKLVEDTLYEVYEDPDAYFVLSMKEMLETMNSMVNIMVGILSGIAGISLVVGGIGIMNIMLVSVTERTREIGIRKALGAKERYIMQQFVIEASVTSAFGGLLGICFGYGLCLLATPIIGSLAGASLTVSPSLFSVLLAFGISAAIGILFGYMPAKKAARLNPIDALHYD